MKKIICLIVLLSAILMLNNVQASNENHVFYWSFDDHGMDASFHNLDATGSSEYIEGVEGKALDLSDGSYLQTDTVPVTFKAFTISLWTKIFENESGYAIMLSRAAKVAGHFELYFAKQGGDGNEEKFEIRVWSPDTGDFTTGVFVEYDKWMHIAVTFDGSVCKIYLDGEKIYESGKVGSLNDIADDSTNFITLGALVDGSLPLNGYLDEVVLANYVIPETDIKKMAEKQGKEDLNALVLSMYPEGTTPRPEPTPTPTPTQTPVPTNTPEVTKSSVTQTPVRTHNVSTETNNNSTVQIVLIIIGSVLVAGVALFIIMKKK